MGRHGQGQCEVSAWWPQLYCSSFTKAVHIGWYHRGSKHWRRTGNGMQHTNRSAVGWLLCYPHLLCPPVRSCRAGRWLAPAHVLSETHAAILFCKFPLELCSIHTLVHPRYGCKSTTSYQGAVSHRWVYLSTCNWGMECCLRRSIRRANIHSVWQIEGRSHGHQSLCWSHVRHIGISNWWDFVDGEHGERADKHKEETEGRKTLDYEDRKKIREELEKGCNPLNTESDYPVNVSNGRVSNSCVNVQDSLQNDTRMVAQFRAGQPDNFHKPLSKQVTTMESMKKSITVGDRQVYDIEKIYSRMLVISQKRCINLREVFMYELSPVPFSLFDQYGDMLSGTKSTLTHRLAQYIPNTDTPNIVIVDGIALIYHVVWPQNGRVQTLCESMVSRVADVNIVDDVYIVFDRCKTGSIKEHERVRRSKGHAAPNHKLTLTKVLPARDIIMKNTLNKQQLAHLLCMCHVPPSVHKLGDVDNIFDHEEADVSMVSYANKFAKECKKEIQILADDTDVFVLLMHWFHKHRPNSHVTLRKFDGQIIDNNVSSEMLGDPCANLLAMHALTGCDSASCPFGKGKVNAIKILKTNCPSLGHIGSPTSSKGRIFEAGRHFFSLL